MTHEELAKKIEALDGPDRNVFIEAYRAVKGPMMETTEKTVCITSGAWNFLNLLDAKAHLDAAASLMPEGWEMVCITYHGGHCQVYMCPIRQGRFVESRAKTEALARLAAAVRAHGKGVECGYGG